MDAYSPSGKLTGHVTSAASCFDVIVTDLDLLTYCQSVRVRCHSNDSFQWRRVLGLLYVISQVTCTDTRRDWPLLTYLVAVSFWRSNRSAFFDFVLVSCRTRLEQSFAGSLGSRRHWCLSSEVMNYLRGPSSKFHFVALEFRWTEIIHWCRLWSRRVYNRGLQYYLFYLQTDVGLTSRNGQVGLSNDTK